MKNKLVKALGMGLLAVVANTTTTAHAAVVISGTRVVFPSSEREVTVRMSNDGQQPGLVQVWLDEGDPNVAPDRVRVPFVLTPPLFRVEPGKGQSVRLLYDGTPLPQDRESLYWLNVLEVPPKPAGEADANYMQMAFRTRIKVFFRPKALNSQELIDDAHAQLRWSLAHGTQGAHVLKLGNPTAYHISVIKIALVDAAGNAIATSEEGEMAPPHKDAAFALKNLPSRPGGKLKVRYTYLNDYGGTVVKEADLNDAIH